LTIGGGTVGNEIGSWQVPTFDCSGTIELTSGGGPLELYQYTTFNGQGGCYSHFTSNVTLQASSLAYEIIGATSTNGVFTAGDPTLASGTLNPT
jgi:heat shock protein HslJ